MKSYNQFHDGNLDGLLIEKDSVAVFLRAYDESAFVLAAVGVVRLAVDEFDAGNIIFDVLTKQGIEITLEDIREVYRLPEGSSTGDKSQMHLDKARERGQFFVQISPSYGATCLILAESVELLTRQEWTERSK